MCRSGTNRNTGDLGNWLHPFYTANADLWYPQSTGHMRPLMTRACALHCAPFVGTEYTLGPKTQRTCPAQPGSRRYSGDPITGLMYTDITVVTKYHLITLF